MDLQLCSRHYAVYLGHQGTKQMIISALVELTFCDSAVQENFLWME